MYSELIKRIYTQYISISNTQNIKVIVFIITEGCRINKSQTYSKPKEHTNRNLKLLQSEPTNLNLIVNTQAIPNTNATISEAISKY